MRVLVTGGAGFIGSAVCERLLGRGDAVVCVDNLNDAYDVRLKEWRLARLLGRAGFRFEKADVADVELTLRGFGSLVGRSTAARRFAS